MLTNTVALGLVGLLYLIFGAVVFVITPPKGQNVSVTVIITAAIDITRASCHVASALT